MLQSFGDQMSGNGHLAVVMALSQSKQLHLDASFCQTTPHEM